MRRFLSILLTMAVIAAGVGIVHATTTILNGFNSAYPNAPATIKTCTLCHTTPPARNSYGNAVSNVVDDDAGISTIAGRIKTIENLDSDKDGYTNITEINAGTFPGDATSNPGVTPPPPPPTSTDGAALYASYCASCHGPLATSSKQGRTATQIQNAINSNTGGMGSLSSLTSAQVQAIATALAPAANACTYTYSAWGTCTNNTQTRTVVSSTPAGCTGTPLLSQACTTTPPTTDGAALYASNCASCHGAIGSSSKKGRTAAQIQSAINGNTGGMSFLSSLTSAQVQAIANALATSTTPPPTTPPPTTPPPTTVDGAALYASNCAACHGALGSSTKKGRTAAQIQSAINGLGIMSGLSSLTSAQVQAISNALGTPASPPSTTPPTTTPPSTTPPPTTVDGAALYASNCAACHGALGSSTKKGRTAAQIQSAINGLGIMSGLSSLTSAQVQAIANALGTPASPPSTTPPTTTPPTTTPPSATLDGAALYATNCAACHGALASSTKSGRTAAQIQAAIDSIGMMAGSSSLTSEQVQAIADALGGSSTPTQPPTTPGQTTLDGAALYASNCAACHGALASSTKKGRTAAQIQAAIGSIGMMSGSSSLTSEQVQAIADALASDTTPPASNDKVAPKVTAFNLPPTSASLTVTIKTFKATDKVGVTGYMVTESSEKPEASADGWSTTAPTSYTFDSAGKKKLYAWVMDAAGNVSKPLSDTVMIKIKSDADTIAPRVTVFNMPGISKSLTATIKALKATDKVGVTGYMVTESSSKPLASDGGWSSTPPASYTFDSEGKKKLYAWAVDAAGNVSNGRMAAVKIKLPASVQSGPDGAALYAANCALCHGPLDSSTKKGTTVSDIQKGIKDIGAMSGLSSLSSADIKAIAGALSPSTAAKAQRLPAKQEVFTYAPVELPVRDADLSKAMPVGVGAIANGGKTLDLRVSTGPFAGPVDITLAVYVPSEDNGYAPVDIYTLQSDGTFVELTGNETIWKSGVTEVNEEISFGIPVSELPAGPYVVILGVSPSDDHSVYYHWMTNFVVK